MDRKLMLKGFSISMSIKNRLLQLKIFLPIDPKEEAEKIQGIKNNTFM